MPGKSKHGRGKHPHRNKIRHRPQGTGQPPMQAAQTSAQPPAQPVNAPARVSNTPKAKTAASMTAMAAMEQSHVVGDLKRIGILTGITIVILIILALIIK
jgi:hypothetical protein